MLNPWNINGLVDLEKDTGRKVNTNLQIQLHDSVNGLKRKVAESSLDTRFDVDLSYITSRGKWYYNSWKDKLNKSGGIANNIGVHFFDLLHYIFFGD